MQRLVKILPFLFSIVLGLFIFRYSLGGLDQSVLNNPSKLIYQYPCEAPITYKIGTIDKQFNITEGKFLKDIQSAASIWNEAYGNSLFEYNKDDRNAVSVNLVFDDRQSLNNQIQKLENVVESSVKDLDSRFAEYKKRAGEFERRLAAFNAEVEKTNNKGGATSEEYESLKKEQEYLQGEASYLNQTAKDLNLSANKYNARVGQLNSSIDNFNEVLKYKPEEGIFDPTKNKIDIYFSNNQTELVHTLAHELGHSKGLDHIENEKAIMFPYSTQVIVPTKEELDSLRQICERKSVWDIFTGRMKLIYEFLIAKYKMV